MRYILFLSLFVLLLSTACTKKDSSVKSPDGTISVSVGSESGKIYYTVNKENKVILNKSFLGFILKDSELDKDFIIKDVKESSFSETWEQPWGEETSVENKYNQLTVNIEESSGLKRKFTVVFRVFNDGVGFRYEFPEQENLKDFIIMDELTEFALADKQVGIRFQQW